jgi:hypothetical protein
MFAEDWRLEQSGIGTIAGVADPIASLFVTW